MRCPEGHGLLIEAQRQALAGMCRGQSVLYPVDLLVCPECGIEVEDTGMLLRNRREMWMYWVRVMGQ